VPIVYTRPAGSPPAGGGIGAVPPPAAGGKVLSEKDGLKLTEDHVRAGVGIIQFVIGGKIKDAEVAELTRTLVQEFGQSPQFVLQQMEGMKQPLAQLNSMTDPLQVGTIRQGILSAFHKATLNVREKDKPLLIQIINRHVKVLAYDPANELVLTDHDADGFLKFQQFCYQLAGLGFDVTEQQRQQFIASVQRDFPTLPVEQKRFLCSARVAWEVTEAYWVRVFNDQQRAQMQAAFAQRASQLLAPKPGAGQPGTTGTGFQYPPGWSTMNRSQQQATFRKMMNDNWAEQNINSMLYRSCLDSHVLGITIASSISDIQPQVWVEDVP
jgi:hypothetical protein